MEAIKPKKGKRGLPNSWISGFRITFDSWIWPGFPFTNAVSLVVNCESQEESDHYREKLAADGARRNR